MPSFFNKKPTLDDKRIIHDIFVEAVTSVWNSYENPNLELTDKHKQNLLNNIKSIPNNLMLKKLTALATGEPNQQEIIGLIANLSYIVNEAINGKSADHQNTNAVHFGIANRINDEFNRLIFQHNELENTLRKIERRIPNSGQAGRKFKPYVGLEAETKALELMVGTRQLSG